MIKLTEIAEALGITQQPQSPPVSPQVVGESPAAVKTLTKEEKKALYELESNNKTNYSKNDGFKFKKRINYEIITTDHNTLNDYYSIDHLKSNYYDNCFLNINLTEGSGLSTVIELGLMGRKTIFKNPYTNNVQRMEFPNFITYKTFDGIISIINEESKKINTLQEPIDAHNVGDEWLDLDFWL